MVGYVSSYSNDGKDRENSVVTQLKRKKTGVSDDDNNASLLGESGKKNKPSK